MAAITPSAVTANCGAGLLRGQFQPSYRQLLAATIYADQLKKLDLLEVTEQQIQHLVRASAEAAERLESHLF